VDDAPDTGNLDLGAVNTRDDLAKSLQAVRRQADKSLRDLEAMTRDTKNPLSKTTVDEMLNAKRFPRKNRMIAFLMACGVKDDNIELWLRAWERVAAREQGLSKPRAVRRVSEAVAGDAGHEEQAKRARGDRMTVATSASAHELGKIEPREQARESGASAISLEELRVFGAELIQALVMRGKTIEEAAAELAVPSAEVVRWAAGEELPSKSQARALDGYLTAQGAIDKRVTELSSRPDQVGPRLVSVPLPSSPIPTLIQTFEGVAAAVRHCLSKDADGKPTGWSPDLRVQGEAMATSTAYGIRTMLLLEDGLAADLVPVAESLREMAVPAGGYAGREQAVPRPETTAAVVNALRRVAVTESFDAHIAQMERDLGDFEKCRPFILATMLETSLLLSPETALVETLVDSLLAARRPYGDLLLWPERAEPFRSAPAASVAHTARAVRVLASVQKIRPASRVQETLAQAVTWLLEQRDLRNAYEVIDRDLPDRPEVVQVRHFTPAWVVKALVSAGVPASHRAVSNAVAQIWDSYGGSIGTLWAWDNGDQPIWMTFDAIEALRLTSLAVSGQLGPPP
jgi:hypothetical protein